MSPRGKKLGLLLSTSPEHPNFGHGLAVADAAITEGAQVYLYCIDDAVSGIGDPRLQALKNRGVKLFACAYAARRRRLVIGDQAVFAGLSVVSDLMAGTDRFVSFN